TQPRLAAAAPSRRSDELQERQRGHRLAAARFSDEPEDLAFVEVERDVVDRLDDASPGEEERPQRSDLEEVIVDGDAVDGARLALRVRAGLRQLGPGRHSTRPRGYPPQACPITTTAPSDSHLPSRTSA